MVKLTWNAEKQVMLRSTQSAEKHVLLWQYHAYFFWWKWWSLNAEKQVMLRSTKSAEKQVLLWHYHAYFFWRKWWKLNHAEKHTICCKACFVVTCLFFWIEMAKLTWNAEKHKICWKACFVVTCLILFDGNGETYMKCWEAQNLLKSMFCCDMSDGNLWNLHEMLRSTKSAEKHVLLWHVYFFDGNGETYMKCWEAGHAEKQKTFAEKHVLLWHV